MMRRAAGVLHTAPPLLVVLLTAAFAPMAYGESADIRVDGAPEPRIVWTKTFPFAPGKSYAAESLQIGPGGLIVLGAQREPAEGELESKAENSEASLLALRPDGEIASRTEFPLRIAGKFAFAVHGNGAVTAAGIRTNAVDGFGDLLVVAQRSADGNLAYTLTQRLGARASHESAIVFGIAALPGGHALVHGHMSRMAGVGPAWAIPVGRDGKAGVRVVIGRWTGSERDAAGQAQFWAVRPLANGFETFVELHQGGADRRYAIRRYDLRGALRDASPAVLGGTPALACAIALPDGGWAIGIEYAAGGSSDKEDAFTLIWASRDGRIRQRRRYRGNGLDNVRCGPAADDGVVLFSLHMVLRIAGDGTLLWVSRPRGTMNRFGPVNAALGLDRGEAVLAGRPNYDVDDEARKAFVVVRFAPPQ